MKKVIAFVPLRLNSKRVIGKNLKLLGNKPLLTYIFNTLTEIKQIDEVYAFCSSEDIKPLLPQKVKFLKRDKSLDDDLTLGKEIYDAFISLVEAEIYILAHATSPFIRPQTISFALDKVLCGDYDSSFSVQKFKTFAWFRNKPLNYSLSHIPRTQDIEPVYIETSTFYIFRREIWQLRKQRIGENSYVQVVDSIEGIDIDNPEDFDLAETIIRGRLENIRNRNDR